MNSLPPRHLAVDLGTSGMKVALMTIHGQVLGWESSRRAVSHPQRRRRATPDDGGRHSCRRRSACWRVTWRRDAIGAVCCSTQGEGTVPVDADGHALMNCILWMDARRAQQRNSAVPST